MPLKLLERVLPWLVGSLSEEEAKSFLQNMHLAGWLSIRLVVFICINKCVNIESESVVRSIYIYISKYLFFPTISIFVECM